MRTKMTEHCHMESKVPTPLYCVKTPEQYSADIQTASPRNY